MCSFKDGASLLTAIASRLGVQSTPLSQHHLRKKDYKRLSRSKYGKSEEAKKHRRAARKKEGDSKTKLSKKKVLCTLQERSVLTTVLALASEQEPTDLQIVKKLL